MPRVSSAPALRKTTESIATLHKSGWRPVRYVVDYDIEEDRARVRIAGVLERFGMRVQKSVFECRLEARDLERLLRRLERELTAIGGAGNVLVYRLVRRLL
jgi:CRISPR-associated protein Cas2